MIRKIFSIAAIGILIISVLGCQSKREYSTTLHGTETYHPTAAETVFMDTLQHRTFLYFWEQCNPEYGLVKDRSSDDSPASIAAMGFAIPAWVIGAEHGWISRGQAAERTLNMLRFLMESRQTAAPVSTGYRGFYYHFLDMQNGLRAWNCELSTVDTAWLIAGIRFAVQYFAGDTDPERDIRKLGDELTRRVDWNWATMPDEGISANTITMSWHPEHGMGEHGWRGYNEALYMYIIAAGTNYTKAPEGYRQWLKFYEWQEPYTGLGHVIFPPLFGHQWSHMFIDCRGMADVYMRQRGIDYFENARRAMHVQHLYAIDNPMGWSGYDSLTWGWTACDGPGDSFNDGKRIYRHYSARGNAGPENIEFDDGTITPTAAGGSFVFDPRLAVRTLMHMYKVYGEQGLWGKYGFLDAFNPTLEWYNKDYLGVDQGPILIMIENFRTGLVWKYCMKDPVIQKGLERLGFDNHKTGAGTSP